MPYFDGNGHEIRIGRPNPYSGKNALWLGDSISVVEDPSYPKKVCTDLDMFLNNKASSGGNSGRMRDILQGLGSYEGQAPGLGATDYVFIMIGHNCDAEMRDSKLSDIPTDTTPYTDFPRTFHGNVGSCVEYIREKNPKTQIYFLTSLQSANPGYVIATAKARTFIEELGVFYSIPIIDVYAECGICQKNVGVYTTDNTHPNAAGVEKISNMIEQYLFPA